MILQTVPAPAVRTACAICALFVLTAASRQVAAQSAIRFTVMPADVEVSVPTGQTVVTGIVVQNDSAHALRFRAVLADLFLRRDGVADTLEDRRLPWSVVPFVRMAPAEFEIPASGRQFVRMAITLPRETRGGRYGAVVVSAPPVLQLPARPRPGAVVIATPRIAARLLISAAGTAEVGGRITAMVASPRSAGRGIDILVTFRNTGNVHVRVKGDVAVLDGGGEAAGVAPLPEGVVLPGTVREFRLSVPASLRPGRYTVRATLDYGADVLLVGRQEFTYPAR
ncbi:MAG: hypothetical protein QN163_05880 [Armatimonadota bacterium]|nr:hypothetical protein [Armatimonadota bacterium]